MGAAAGKPPAAEGKTQGELMSPLATVLMKVMRWGLIGIAGFLALVLAIEAWKHGWDLAAMNRGFAGVVGLLALGCLWLARSIGRELVKHGS